jgi:site-specific DNA recombinase
MIVIHRLSRFGRNAMELLNNYNELKQAGIALRSIAEGIDFGSRYGEAMLGMLAIVAQLERDIIRETTLENRIARGQRGIPTSGAMPYGRRYDKATGTWILDKDKADKIREVADEYLRGGNLERLAATVPMSYNNLIKILTLRAGDTWTVNFKDKTPITYAIPRILEDAVILRIKDRLAFNRKNNRTDVPNKYLLTGFIRCAVCKATISGQNFHSPYGDYRYYVHRVRSTTCRAMTYVKATEIENAVMRTIFENIVDVPSFERAIADSMPDERMIRDLRTKITSGEKALKRVKRDLTRLIDSVLKGTLSDETVRETEAKLVVAKNRIEETLQADRERLSSIPDVATIRQEANTIRRALLEKYSGPQRLQLMSFDERRVLLHWLFDGRDHEDTAHGIYITVRELGKRQGRGRGREHAVDYFMYGRLWGIRTLRGDDINYMGSVDEEIAQEKDADNITYPLPPAPQL